MTARYKPFDVYWPLSPDVVEGINQNFDELFKDLKTADDTATTALADAAAALQPPAGMAAGDILFATSATELDVLAATGLGRVLLSGSTSGPTWSGVAGATQVLVGQGAGSDPTWGAVPAHDLLSSVHGDTVAGSPTAGDLIVANTTPAWTQLAISGSGGKFLRSNGATPSWQAILETDITDGGLLARIGDNEIISGLWKFNSGAGFGATPASGQVLVTLTSGAGIYAVEIRQGTTTSGSSFGMMITGGTTSGDDALRIRQLPGLGDIFKVRGDGAVGWGTAPLTFIPDSADIALTASTATLPIDLAADVTGTLPVANGGTGATTLTDGGLLLGSGTGAITALGVATNGQIPIGDGTTDPVLATLTGTANEITVTNGAGSITLSLPANVTIAGDLTVNGGSGSNVGLLAQTNIWTATQQISGAVPRLVLYETDQAADEKAWHILVASAHLRFLAGTDAGSAIGSALTLIRGTGTAVANVTVGTDLIVEGDATLEGDVEFDGLAAFDRSIVVGSPTGGDKGAGTINAQAVYDDNTLLTDFVFDEEYRLPPIEEMEAFFRQHRHLPTIKGRAEWEAGGGFSVGQLATMLWETVEVQARYIAEIDGRLTTGGL
jgi:hypothetical protein